MGTPISVVIPVGPFPVYKRWLPECLDSVRVQTYPADEVLIVDDMAGVEAADLGDFADHRSWNPDMGLYDLTKTGQTVANMWHAPWRLGSANSFNCGVGLAKNDLVFLLSCDDTLEPECLELCVAEWEKQDRKDAVYWVGAHHIGPKGETTAPDQTTPFCNSMVTKGLWRMTGGLLPAQGNGDWVFLQMLGKHFPGRCLPVAGGKVLYSCRYHDQSITVLKHNPPTTWPKDWGRME